MSNFSYDDFAVLVRSFKLGMLSSDSLRIVPLSTAPSMADAIHGTSLAGLDSLLNLPREKNGAVVRSNVTVQHDSAGYCRLVGHIEAVKPQDGQGVPVTTAKAFVLYHLVKDGSVEGVEKPEVIAVASLKEGFAIGDVCYPSFTITTVNNYQSVAFNPNAFATVEDLKNINGIDCLHIAFDTASGDLKLLDKDGNVLDQANLPIKADVIIADGEEGYKYVKTDVAQDIHAAKAWMPEGSTAWEEVLEAPYKMQHAALVVGKGSSRVFVSSKPELSCPISTQSVEIEHVKINGSTYMVAAIQEGTCNLFKIKGDSETCLYQNCKYERENVSLPDKSQHPISNQPLENVDVIKDKDGVTTYVLVETANSDVSGSKVFQALSLDGTSSPYSGTIVTSDRVLGITHDGINLYTFDENAETHSEILNISGGVVRWLDRKPLTEVPNRTLKYGLEAFVWTVKDRKVTLDGPFFNQLNASLLALGFHEGDDIALGTNLATLAPTEGVSPLNNVDADDYIHGKNNKATREQEVDTQRNLAKEELAEWNKQHPALSRDDLNGTRISSDGVDIRNGKIEIGNGVDNKGEYNVKRYVIETDIDVVGDVARADTGLQIGVIDSVQGGTDVHEPIQKDILTINAEGYISGAPTCLALLKCSKDSSDGLVSARLTGGRITANFTASGSEDGGVFTLTITDNRANNGFGDASRIVEIIPVYKSGADASEAVPAQRSISAIASAVLDNGTGKSTLSIRCSQVIDWAQSIDLGGTVGTEGQGTTTGNGMELYLIVKVY